MSLRKMLKRCGRMARDGWLMLGAIALVLGIYELGARAIEYSLPTERDALRAREAVRGMDEQYWHEWAPSSRTRWEPYVFWRHRELTGELANIDHQGLRRTWAPDPPPAAGPVPRRVDTLSLSYLFKILILIGRNWYNGAFPVWAWLVDFQKVNESLLTDGTTYRTTNIYPSLVQSR